MNDELVRYFQNEVCNTVRFIHRNYNFSAPQLLVNKEICFAFVVFLGKNIAIEFILDEREEDITCKISRVRGGTKTEFYSVDEKEIGRAHV